MILGNYGYVRAAAAVPRVSVGDPAANADQIAKMIKEGAQKGVRVMVFPELAITGYTCGDLFNQSALVAAAERALGTILEKTAGCELIAAIGLPVASGNQLFNCAAVIYEGAILGVVAKTFLPNYNEFYEKRWFAPAQWRLEDSVRILGTDVPFGEDLIFRNLDSPLCIGVEICEDLWTPIPQSSRLALCGANLILNLSASDEAVTKADYRRELVKQQSGRCFAGYVLCSAGPGESTTDVVFGGHSLIAANDSILAEASYPEDSLLLYADIDVEAMMGNRRKSNSFLGRLPDDDCRAVTFSLKDDMDVKESFTVNPHPFVPSDKSVRDGRCREIFRMQATGLAERMRKTGIKKAVIGVSGGLDSTLALLVTAEAVKSLRLPLKSIIGVTMPGFGTTDRTYQNALTLMREMGTTIREVSIKAACAQHFADIGQDPGVHDIAYENTQARERTQILFDISNMEGGLVVGTGDMSELALGWCTYNGDHMSNYAVNSGVPKTLVSNLISWYAETAGNKKVAAVLSDILDTPISPELLPADKNGNIVQKTEDVVGPYELHDFFLFHMIRNGFSPTKILKLATLAFEGKYAPRELCMWLEVFYRRFFAQQFKRSCLPDGVKVGSVCLSPRGDWRMPSDASPGGCLGELKEAQARLGKGIL